MAVVDPSVILLQGDDAKLLADAVIAAVEALVGDRERIETVHELWSDDYEVGAIIDAVNTPPFLTDRRIVVARGIERFDGDELKALVPALADPLPGVHLVMERAPSPKPKRVPKAVTDAIKAGGGEVRSTSVSSRGNERGAWIDARLAAAGVRLDRAAGDLLVEHLGSDIARADAIIEVLAATYGHDHQLRVADVVPYLGEAGDIPPWELTDPIDRGDVVASVDALERMLTSGSHPLQVMAILHRHVGQAVRLDGSGVRDDKAAAEVLGLKGSTFPAKKARERARSVGTAGLRDQINLLADADLDLRGRSGLDGSAVLDVVVARLADPRRRR